MEFAGLKKHLNSDKPFACYYCYGDDEYVVSRAVALLKELAAEPQAFNVSDKSFSSSAELIDELMQLPLTGEYRVVIARGKVDAEAVAEYLKKPNPSSVLAVVNYTPHDSWNKRSAPTVPAGAVSVVCDRLSVQLVTPFIRSSAAKAGAAIGDKEINLLYSRCGGYLTRMNPEIQKLAVMRAGSSITCEDINREVRADTEFVIFELIDCIIERNTQKALAIVDGIAKNDDIVAAFTLLYNRLKRIFAAAVDPDDLKLFDIKDYMAARLKREAARFSKVRLKSLLDSIANADYSYKTGVMSSYDALYSFVAQASSGG